MSQIPADLATRLDDAKLLPAIAQDSTTGEVLMLAWINRESLQLTLDTGYAIYWSRSRNSLWKKGETSGNLQKIIEIKFDCDADAVLFKVEQHGPACHTGQTSCFHNSI